MISCNKGVCRIEGSTAEVRADLTTLIHAVDMTFIEHYGKDESEEMINEAVEFAFEHRDDKDVTKEDVISLIDDLKKILEEIKDGSTK